MTSPTPPLVAGATPVLGHIMPLLHDPLRFLRGMRDHGDVLTIRLGPKTLYALCTPELVDELLIRNGQSVDVGGRLWDTLRVLLGDGLATSNGAKRAALCSTRDLSQLLASSQLGITLCTLAPGAITKPAVHHTMTRCWWHSTRWPTGVRSGSAYNRSTRSPKAEVPTTYDSCSTTPRRPVCSTPNGTTGSSQRTNAHLTSTEQKPGNSERRLTCRPSPRGPTSKDPMSADPPGHHWMENAQFRRHRIYTEHTNKLYTSEVYPASSGRHRCRSDRGAREVRSCSSWRWQRVVSRGRDRSRPLPPRPLRRKSGDLRMWYDEPAPDDNSGWIDRSIPMGNGALGVNLFGGVSRERLQLTENSLQDYDGDNVGGLNNFAEVYLDFPHTSPSEYTRDLVLDDGIAHVSYSNGGVDYEREVFASHDTGVVAVKLSASKPGELSFTLRPEVPYLREGHAGNSNRGKTGTVTADGDTITMTGAMEYYDVRYEGQFRVIPTGGTMTASNPSGKGQIAVADADSAVVLIACGTNYQMVPQVFSEPDRLKKLDGLPLPHDKVSAAITNAAEKGYSGLRAEHLKYYQRLYGRVRLDLGGTEPTVPTDEVIDAARAGNVDPYLEELAFQFGRYLLISGSREGSLPLNLQGLWNVYEDPPWRSGYWHNVNLQMNYWPTFQTNLPETFRPYVEYNAAYLPVQQNYATDVIRQYQPSHLDPGGDNGWAMGNSNWPYKRATRPGHSGFGTGPWTAQLFWDYYDYTRDKELLRDVVYPVLEGQSNFLSRFVSEIDGKLLATPSQSPENSGPETAGTTFDQQQIYENHRNTLAAAKILGISTSTNPRLATYRDQLAKLDPIVIGTSGQIKEYREETSYGSVGDPKHRHISQLLGLYPGQLVNSSTRAWLDAAKVSLDGRGAVGGTGWAQAERIGTWARAQDGTKAYSFFTYWLKRHAMHNLWNNHRDSHTNQLFQVDGNFGVTAGVSEMLLQSHDGAVAPLAAIPAQWREGTYSGLLARGGFEVSATWVDSRATRFDVTSRAGGRLELRYPELNGAVVKDSRGRTVHYTGRSADEISLPTQKGQTYTVTSIPRVSTVAAPSDLKVDADSGDKVKLTWTPSDATVGTTSTGPSAVIPHTGCSGPA